MLTWKIATKASALSIAFGCFLALASGPAARAQDPPRYKYDPDCGC
jgi:hypothetical protein